MSKYPKYTEEQLKQVLDWVASPEGQAELEKAFLKAHQATEKRKDEERAGYRKWIESGGPNKIYGRAA